MFPNTNSSLISSWNEPITDKLDAQETLNLTGVKVITTMITANKTYEGGSIFVR